MTSLHVGSIAQQIPEELFDHILWQAVDGQFTMTLATGIPPLCLVCRYWAAICREKLHRHLIFHSSTRLQRFFALLESTPSPLKPIVEYVRQVTCTVEAKDLPWLHQVRLRIIPRVDWPVAFEVRFRSPAPDDEMANVLRPLYPGLPRSLPRSLSKLNRLTLCGTRFRDGADLHRFILSISPRCSITLADVTWTTKPDVNTFAPFALSDTLVSFCTECKASSVAEFGAFWLLPAIFKDRPRRHSIPALPAPSSLNQEDYRVLTQIYALLGNLTSWERPAFSAIHRYQFETDVTVDFSRVAGNFGSDKRECLLVFRLILGISPVREGRSEDPQQGLRVQKLELRCVPDEEFKASFSDLDLWSSFCDLAGQLPKLRNLTVHANNDELASLLFSVARQGFRMVARQVELEGGGRKVRLSEDCASDREWESKDGVHWVAVSVGTSYVGKIEEGRDNSTNLAMPTSLDDVTPRRWVTVRASTRRR